MLVGVQAAACAPLVALFEMGVDGLHFITEAETVAEGVRVRAPVRADAVLKTLEECRGRLVAVPEARILPGRDAAGTSGVLCGAHIRLGVARNGNEYVGPSRSRRDRFDWIRIQVRKLAGDQMERIVITGMGTINPIGNNLDGDVEKRRLQACPAWGRSRSSMPAISRCTSPRR